MTEITQIRVGGSRGGLLGLGEVFEKVRAEGPETEDALWSRLLDLVSRRNYITEERRPDYARALVREYRKHIGEDVEPESWGGLEIRVLGPGCPNCERLMEKVRAVLHERGAEADLEHVRDLKEIARYGPVATPALIINGRVISSGRSLPRGKIIQAIEEAVR